MRCVMRFFARKPINKAEMKKENTEKTSSTNKPTNNNDSDIVTSPAFSHMPGNIHHTMNLSNSNDKNGTL